MIRSDTWKVKEVWGGEGAKARYMKTVSKTACSETVVADFWLDFSKTITLRRTNNRCTWFVESNVFHLLVEFSIEINSLFSSILYMDECQIRGAEAEGRLTKLKFSLYSSDIGLYSYYGSFLIVVWVVYEIIVFCIKYLIIFHWNIKDAIKWILQILNIFG